MRIIDVNDIHVGDTFICILSDSTDFIYGNKYTVNSITKSNFLSGDDECYFIWVYTEKNRTQNRTQLGFPLRKVDSPIMFLDVMVAYFDRHFDTLKNFRKRKLKNLCK